MVPKTMKERIEIPLDFCIGTHNAQELLGDCYEDMEEVELSLRWRDLFKLKRKREKCGKGTKTNSSKEGN